MYITICDYTIVQFYDYQTIPMIHLSQSIRFIYNMTSDSQTMLEKDTSITLLQGILMFNLPRLPIS